MTFLLCLYLDQHKITSLDIYPFSSDLETPLLGYMNTVTFLEDSKTFTCFQLSLILTPQTYTAKDTGSGSKMLLFFFRCVIGRTFNSPTVKTIPPQFLLKSGQSCTGCSEVLECKVVVTLYFIQLHYLFLRQNVAMRSCII